MRPVTLAWWVWAIALGLIFAWAMLAARLDAAEPIQCVDGLCLVPEPVFRQVLTEARKALEYRDLCRWP